MMRERAIEPQPTLEIRPTAMLLLGIAACGDKDLDSAYQPQPAYGIAVDTGFVDNDGDGFAEADGDCNDTDPLIHPEAEETAGDGTDSNCNGEDDT